VNSFVRIVLVAALWATLFSVRGNDLGPVEAPVLKRQILVDSSGTADGSALLRAWKPLSERQPAVSLRLAGDGQGRSLHLSYFLPPPGAGGEFGALLALPDADATEYDHLALWIKGDPEEGFNSEFEVQFRRPDPAGNGMQEVGRFLVSGIADRWQRMVIPLNYLIGIKDWTRLSAFAVVFPATGTKVRKGGYFLGEIALIKTGKPGPGTGDLVVAERKQAWENALGGEAATRPHLKARLAGWPDRLVADGKSLPRDDREFLMRIAADTWRGLDAFTDRSHGLPLDRVQFNSGSTAPEQTHIGDYTSITDIGFHFLNVVSAYELHLIDRGQALEKLSATLATLDGLESYRGFYYNYYNTTTLERTSNFLSFVDSAWLTAGLMVARQAFPELAARCTRLIEQGDYRFFYDPGHGLMSHGYYVNLGLRSTYHYGVFYAESRIGSLIAIGKGDAPEEHWFRMARTFPPEFRWQSRPPLERAEKTAGGFHWTDGHYRWREYRYVPSWGGSLFEALMPALVLDEQRHAPHSLGYNDRVHTAIHRRYALEELGFPVWGMSPSSTPGADRYDEYGVKFLGSAGYRSGIVTPHAAALALLTEPAEAAANLRKLAELYPVYGDFGFYDAVNPATGDVAYNYLCLNQSMILAALANHLADHAVQKHFAADPIVRRVLALLGIEKFGE
jgi:hypothetical protein